MGVAPLRTLPTGALRAVAMVVCAGGIAGMIIGSIADNNGVAVTFGLLTAAAAISLLAISAVGPASVANEPRALDEVDARALEAQIQVLVDQGADEAQVRHLVRHALAVGRGRKAEDCA